MTWIIHPNVGLSDLKFAMSRQEVAKLLDPVQSITGTETLVDGTLTEFRGMTLPVCNYRDGRLRCLDTHWSMAPLTLDGEDLFALPGKNLLTSLEKRNGGAVEISPAEGDRPIIWRTALRNARRFGLPFAGVAVIVHYMVASIRGEINRLGFAMGMLQLGWPLARLPRGPSSPRCSLSPHGVRDKVQSCCHMHQHERRRIGRGRGVPHHIG